MFTCAASARKSNPIRKTRATSRPCAARATASRPQSEPWRQKRTEKKEVRNRIFFKLLAAFVLVILAAAATFDFMVGGAWQASLRTEIERNLIQKTQLLAHRVETDRTGHSLADIAAQEGQSAGARVTIIDPTGKVLADSEADPATMENHATRPEFIAALSGKIGSNERRSATLGIPFLYVAAP